MQIDGVQLYRNRSSEQRSILGGSAQSVHSEAYRQWLLAMQSVALRGAYVLGGMLAACMPSANALCKAMQGSVPLGKNLSAH